MIQSNIIQHLFKLNLSFFFDSFIQPLPDLGLLVASLPSYCIARSCSFLSLHTRSFSSPDFLCNLPFFILLLVSTSHTV
jgi:hypothetical protein